MNTDKIEGLSSAKVLVNRKKFGFNEISGKNRRNIFKIIYNIITEPMILLLMATVGIYFILGDISEAFLLLVSFFGIIGIGLYQNIKTEKSLEALKDLSSPICDVIRDGKRITIPGREVVIGDIMILFEGIRVPADAKLLSAENFNVDESLLTGESEPVEKSSKSENDDRIKTVFSGTLIVKGHGIAEVTGIGKNTEIGQIGTSLKSIGIEKTLLQKEVNKVIKLIAILAIGASILLTIIYWIIKGNLIQGILAGLTLAIAILPEEFPVVLTIFLTLGAWRLAKHNVLTRRVHTIETLGSATVLCVDKTGTLTENKMEISAIIDSQGVIYNDNFDAVAEVVKYGVLASQKEPFDPMEEAFIIAGESVFKNVNKIYEQQNIIKEYPLESKSLSVVHVWGIDKKVKYVALKGAPETVFDLCHLSNDEKNKLKIKVKELASQGLRVITVAKGKITASIPENRHDFDFDFLGLVGLADPIRKEALPAIKICKEAGIKVVMITGDYPETAAHIAEKLGLDYKNSITGSEFEKLSESERIKIVKSISVFSRVNPNHKLVIVNTFKKIGEVVAMTGDGVNDAPALKSAHVGVAMGQRGTDVARESASIVLLDDDFASIVQGVRLGRRIYDNLQKAMSYIISVHIPIALMSFLPILFGWPLALIPVHIVFLEFIIDPSSTIIFENEKEADNLMQRPPRKLNQPIFNKKMVIGSLAQGLIVAVIVVLAYKILLDLGWEGDKARGMTFLILIVANIFLVLGISGKQAIANIFNRENKAMLVILSITSISLAIIFNVPFLRDMFHFAPLSIIEASVGVLVGSLSVFGIILLRFLVRVMTKRQKVS